VSKNQNFVIKTSHLIDFNVGQLLLDEICGSCVENRSPDGDGFQKAQIVLIHFIAARKPSCHKGVHHAGPRLKLNSFNLYSYFVFVLVQLYQKYSYLHDMCPIFCYWSVAKMYA
jgi:hypothetical protein